LGNHLRDATRVRRYGDDSHGAAAGGRPEHIVRLTWYLTSRDEYLRELPAIGVAYRAVMGKHFPAMTVLQVVALLDVGAKVEIEATAVVPEP
jgi:enamine deaminase RidA (YjgF/YER057c/UK114 family)